MIINKFINEINNDIKIRISKYKGFGVNSKTQQKIAHKGVKIQMFGPTSMSENEITVKEAKELYKSLGEFFKKYKN